MAKEANMKRGACPRGQESSEKVMPRPPSLPTTFSLGALGDTKIDFEREVKVDLLQEGEEVSKKRRASDSVVDTKDAYSSRQAALRQKRGLQELEDELAEVNAGLASNHIVLLEAEDLLIRYPPESSLISSPFLVETKISTECKEVQ